MARAEDEEMNKIIEDMLARGVIEPSVGPYCLPAFVIQQHGKPRFILDARALNALLADDPFPLPIIRDLFDRLTGALYFTTLDLFKGFWQISILPSDRSKTSFRTARGLYQFRVLPFGVKTAPAAFQRLVQAVIGDLLCHGVLVYIDDLLIYSNSKEEHLRLLNLVFERLASANLIVNVSKCHFLKKEVKFLGHIVDSSGVHVDQAYVKAVDEFPPPMDVKSLQRFLGLANFYHSFVRDYATIAAPLYSLLSLGIDFIWSNECAMAFNSLKQALRSAPVLVPARYELPFVLFTDASDVGVGGICGQAPHNFAFESGDPPPQHHVIGYASKRLDAAQRNYTVTEKETFAIVFAVSKFRPYLYGHRVHVYTDHRAIAQLWTRPRPSPSQRLNRWLNLLQGYDMVIHFTPGSTQVHVDALSRAPVEGNTLVLLQRSGVMERLENVPESSLKWYQSSERWCREVYGWLEASANGASDKTPPITNISEYTVLNGLLWKKTRLHGRSALQAYVPSSLRVPLLHFFHEGLGGGHAGEARMFLAIRQKYYWPGYYRDITKYVAGCTVCQPWKRATTEGNVPTIPLYVEAPFERIGTDSIGPLPETRNGNRYIIVFVDFATRWPEAFAVPDHTCGKIASLLYTQIICRYGPPKELLSDRGTNFLSKLVSKVCDLFDVHTLHTTAYHPACNGLTERTNGILGKILSKLATNKPDTWDEHLPAALFASRVTPSSVTKFSPFELMYGRRPRLPIDVLLDVPTAREDCASNYESYKDSITETRRLANALLEEEQAKIANREDPNSWVVYNVGDKVWLYTPHLGKGQSRKFCPKWTGPYVVKECLPPVNYAIQRVDDVSDLKMVHVSRLKMFIGRETPSGLPDFPRAEDPEDSVEPSPSTEVVSAPVNDAGASTVEYVSHNVDGDTALEVEATPWPDKPVEVIKGVPYYEPARIVDVRWRNKHGRKQRQYLVQWKDHEGEDSWEPSYRLRNCTDVVEEFTRRIEEGLLR
jgi:hypothetical protein